MHNLDSVPLSALTMTIGYVEYQTLDPARNISIKVKAWRVITSKLAVSNLFLSAAGRQD